MPRRPDHRVLGLLVNLAPGLDPQKDQSEAGEILQTSMSKPASKVTLIPRLEGQDDTTRTIAGDCIDALLLDWFELIHTTGGRIREEVQGKATAARPAGERRIPHLDRSTISTMEL